MVFKIEPLQLPDPIKQPQVDFRPIGEIGDAVAAYRRRQQIADTLAGATDVNGGLDVDKAGAELARQGLLDEARPMLALAQQKAALAQTVAHQQATLGEETRHNRATEATATEALNKPHYVETSPDYLEGQPGGVMEIRPNGGASRFITPNSLTAQPQAAAPPPNPPPIALASDEFSKRFAGEPAPSPAAAASPGNSLIARIRAAKAVGATPDQLEQMLPAALQSTVHGLAAYDQDPAKLSARGASKTGGMAFRDQLIALTKEIHPEYGTEHYTTKQQTLNDFAKGPEGRTVRSVNNLVEHLDVAEELVHALNNGDNQVINEAKNKFRRIFGYEAPSNAAAVAPIVGGELNKVIAGANGGGIDERSQAAIAALGQQKSPGQALTDIQYIKRLMAGQAHGLQRQYEAGTHGSADFREKYLSPQTRAALDKLEGKTGAAPAIPKVTNAAEANTLIGQARDAIAQGAPRDAVLKRLLDAGVPPTAAAAATSATAGQ